jgi:diguanylate cyclase
MTGGQKHRFPAFVGRPRVVEDGQIVLEQAAGALFGVGAGACATAAVIDGGRRTTRAFLAAALALAGAASFAGDPPLLWLLSVLAATAALVAVVRDRFARVPALSWLDAIMAATAAGALVALLGGDAPLIAAVGGAAGGLALSRWQPSLSMLLVAAGILLLGSEHLGTSVLAVPPVVLAAVRREGRADPGPDFRYTVLAAIILCALTALAILAFNQFTMLSDAAGALAIVTVVVGIVRAGATVTDRIHRSDRAANTDALTGLANRRRLLERLDEVIEHRGDIALLLIDLDGFKELNDTLGHHAGDEVLRQIGPRLGAAVRDHDTLARLGGDEFALVLAPGDEAGASAAGLRLRTALEQSFDLEGISVHINASVGIALYPEHATTADGLLQRADVAMYEAKRMRTGHEIYVPARDRHSRDRLALVGELREAIDEGQLVLHYQPKASLTTGRVEGVEALLRWEHPDRGLLGPGEFLPIAEQSGLSRALTSFVARRAIDEVDGLLPGGLQVNVAINLGPADLLDLGLPSDVAAILDRAGLSPDRLQLEVSEDIIMTDPDRTIDVLERLRALGLGIALDDFGAGHSSLSHLRSLHVDELKIDRSFVLQMPGSAPDAAIVRSSIDLARRLGLRVVAEGVATPQAWGMLADWGCDEAQGFLLAKPMPAHELRVWLLHRRPIAPKS